MSLIYHHNKEIVFFIIAAIFVISSGNYVMLFNENYPIHIEVYIFLKSKMSTEALIN